MNILFSSVDGQLEFTLKIKQDKYQIYMKNHNSGEIVKRQNKDIRKIIDLANWYIDNGLNQIQDIYQ